MPESTHNKHVAYIKQWVVYAKTIDSVDVLYVSDFLSVMFDKGDATINIAKRVATIY